MRKRGPGCETFAVYEGIGIDTFIITGSYTACYQPMKDLKEIYPVFVNRLARGIAPGCGRTIK